MSPAEAIDLEKLEVRKLQEGDDLSSFDCSQDDEMGINEFIHKEAWDFQKARLGITYLFCYEKEIVGFVTLSMGDIRAEQIQEDERLPVDVKTYPALYVGRLAVSNRFRKQGIGRFIVMWCVGFALDKSSDIGCRYITLHTRRRLIGFYIECKFLVALGEESHPTVLMYQRIMP